MELYLHSLKKVNEAQMNLELLDFVSRVGGLGCAGYKVRNLSRPGSYVVASVVCGNSTLQFSAYSSNYGS